MCKRLYDSNDHSSGLMPRELLQCHGVGHLRDIDLISILLGSGVSGKSIDKLAVEVLNLLDHSNQQCQLDELLAINGIGLAKATLILAALEFSRRIYRPLPRRIFSPTDVYSVVGHLADRQENFFSISLNGANEVIRVRHVTRGTVNRTLVHPREVFADPLIDRAASIVVAHNHPSGDIVPSREDKEVTARLQKAGLTLGIPLMDHLIFSHNDFFSFLEKGAMQSLPQRDS